MTLILNFPNTYRKITQIYRQKNVDLNFTKHLSQVYKDE